MTQKLKKQTFLLVTESFLHVELSVMPLFIAVATTEEDKAITSSDFLKIVGISPPKMSQLG